MDKRIRIGRIVAAIIFAIIIWVSPSNPPPIPEPVTEYGNEYVQILATNLEKPWAIDFAGDKIFVTEKVGRVRVIESGILLDDPLATLRTANVFDGGLLGIAVHRLLTRIISSTSIIHTKRTVHFGTKFLESLNQTTSLMLQKQYLTTYQDPHITTEELSNLVLMGNSM